MFNYIKRYWKENLIVGLILLGAATSQTIASVLNAEAFNALIALELDRFLTAVVQMLFAWLLFLIFTYVQIVKVSQTKQKMLTAIRGDITHRIEQTSYSNFHERQVGTYTSWLSNDMTTIETQTFDGFYNVLSGLIATVTSVIALLFFHWTLVLWSFFAGAVTLLLPRLYEKKMSEASLFTTQENERFLSRASDMLGGFDTLFSFGLLKRMHQKINHASLNLETARNNQARVTGRVAVLGALGNIFGQLSTLVLTGFLAFQALVSIGSIASTGNLAGTIFNTVGNLSQQIASIRSTRPIFEKFESIKLVKEKDTDKTSTVKKGFKLTDVSYSYGDKCVLKEVSHEFKRGGKFAVVGASGSGKSTLLNVLNGKLTDYDGSVTFNQTELKHMSGKDLRKQILYIDQIPYLFEGTIRENITLGENFGESKMTKALKESALEEVITALPQGLDTSVGEGGRLFSGGQRQRIALARGLIRGKTWILVDEGTSSLDEASALEIEERLVSNPKLTVIMITHHLRESIKDRLTGILTLK